jgi:hypothetical protein
MTAWRPAILVLQISGKTQIPSEIKASTTPIEIERDGMIQWKKDNGRAGARENTYVYWIQRIAFLYPSKYDLGHKYSTAERSNR